MSPILAEVFGTAILIVLGDGVVANVVLQRTKGHNSGWIVITAGWAFGVTIAVYCVNSISGAHLNPAVTIALAIETTGFESGQLLNMLFGNTSLQDDVALIDVDMPSTFAERFGGPRFGIAGIREITGVHDRPLTCSALKPQGLEPAQYAAIARTFARAFSREAPILVCSTRHHDRTVCLERDDCKSAQISKRATARFKRGHRGPKEASTRSAG